MNRTHLRSVTVSVIFQKFTKDVSELSSSLNFATFFVKASLHMSEQIVSLKFDKNNLGVQKLPSAQHLKHADSRPAVLQLKISFRPLKLFAAILLHASIDLHPWVKKPIFPFSSLLSPVIQP